MVTLLPNPEFRCVNATQSFLRGECNLPEVVRWSGAAGFLPRPMSLGILGTKGFFEFFDLKYSARNHWIEIVAVDSPTA